MGLQEPERPHGEMNFEERSMVIYIEHYDVLYIRCLETGDMKALCKATCKLAVLILIRKRAASIHHFKYLLMLQHVQAPILMCTHSLPC